MSDIVPNGLILMENRFIIINIRMRIKDEMGIYERRLLF